MTPTARRFAATIFLLIAAAVFLFRTVLKPGERLWDFAIYSTAARAYIQGHNPYDQAYLRTLWDQEAVAASGSTQSIDWLYSIVPPPTLLLLAGPAMLPRAIGFPLWIGLSLAILLLAIVALADLILRPSTEARLKEGGALKPRPFAHLIAPPGLVLLAGFLLLGPAQSVVHSGQPAGPAIGMIILALWARMRERPVLAGVLLGIATCLKSQLGLPFVVLFILRPPRKSGWIAVAGIVLIAAASLIPLRGISWADDWARNVSESASNGHPNDYSTANPSRDHLLNLQMPAFAFVQHRMAADVIALTIAGALGLVWLIAVIRRCGRGTDGAGDCADKTLGDAAPRLLLPAAALAAIALLPVYHRYYDATLLAIPLAWAIASLKTRQRKFAIATLFLLAPFVLPVGWQMNLAKKLSLSPALTQSTFWLAGISALQAWLTLSIALTLLLAMGRGTDARFQVPTTPAGPT